MQPGRDDLGDLRAIAPVVISGERIAVAIMQLQDWIGQGVHDWTGPASQRRPDRANDDSFCRTTLNDETTNHGLVQRRADAATRRDVDEPRHVAIELVGLHQTNPLPATDSADDSRVISR